jgi:hypothetical protein
VYSNLDNILEILFKHMPEDVDYNHRAGIHVHVDFSTRKVQDVLKFILVYLTVEEILFQFVGPERQNNIYCVSALETHVCRYLLSFNTLAVAKPSKYSALNPLPLTKFGTLEFRHFQSTNNISKIKDWITFINRIQDYVDYYIDEPLVEFMDEILALRCTSEYISYLHSIFGYQLLKDIDERWMMRSVNSAVEKINLGLLYEPMPVGSAIQSLFT